MLQTYVSFLINARLRAVNFIKQQKLFARGSPSRQGAGAPVPTSGTSTTFFRVLTNMFHRCFHLYTLMGSNIIVCIYGVAYTFIQLFKAVIFAVKSSVELQFYAFHWGIEQDNYDIHSSYLM